MKKAILYTELLLITLSLLCCTKPSNNNGGGSTTPVTPPNPPTPVEVDYVEIADANFKTYLLNNFDTDKDGRISTDEAKKVIVIDCSSKGIKSLSGIRCFSELTSLNCSGNEISSLSLSSRATKGTISEGDCSKLTNLDCSNNKITQIILDNCPSLSSLNAGSNELTEINVSNSPALEEVNVSGNAITVIDVSSNPVLKELNVSGNEIKEIDVSSNPALKELNVSGNALEEINVSNNPELSNLNVSGNDITSIDVTNNPSLKELNVSGNDISFIDISDNPCLENLDCTGNENLSEIVAEEGQKVEEIIKIENPVPTVTSIDVTDVSLSENTKEIKIGDSFSLTAIITPENATNKNVSWFSSNPSIATVDSKGNVHAVAIGTATIKVRTQNSNKEASCAVTVQSIPVSGVSLDKETLTLVEGKSETLVAIVNPYNATNKSLRWRSSDVAVATVDANGKVTAIKEGTATITVTTADGGKSANCSVTVKSNPNLENPEEGEQWGW